MLITKNHKPSTKHFQVKKIRWRLPGDDRERNSCALPTVAIFILPLPNRADHILSLIRKYSLAFLDQTIKKQASPLLEKSLQSQEAKIEVFPPN
jgi:hypothetical protein